MYMDDGGKARIDGGGGGFAQLDLDMEECLEGLFDRDPETGQMDSLATVLLQEIDRFNGLLANLRESLVLLRKAIKGLIVMSGDLEQMFDALLANKVPPGWDKAGPYTIHPPTSPQSSACNKVLSKLCKLPSIDPELSVPCSNADGACS